jgi:hypothetical protein
VALTSREAAEVFHLLFLSQLGTKLDKKLCAVKGGCNLRFFFGSPRFSENLDLDVTTIQQDTLLHKIDRLLGGRPLTLQLAAKGLELEGFTAPKQTLTTQRWKVQLSGGPGRALHTKIEFSRRGLSEGVAFEPVDPALVRAYKVSAVSATHYVLDAALAQKVAALAGRAETQARDVFDADFLLRSGANPDTLSPDARARISEALANATAVTFDAFSGQVLPYLPEDQQADFDAPTWDAAVLRVVKALEEVA